MKSFFVCHKAAIFYVNSCSLLPVYKTLMNEGNHFPLDNTDGFANLNKTPSLLTGIDSFVFSPSH